MGDAGEPTPYRPPQSEPAPTDAAPPALPLLVRAFPLAVGGALRGLGGFVAVALLVLTAMVSVLTALGAPTPQGGELALIAVTLLVGAAAAALGHGLTRGAGWSRLPSVGVGLLLLFTQLRPERWPIAWVVCLGIACLLLLSPRFRPWFTQGPTARAVAAHRACAAGTTWVAATACLPLAVEPLREVFQSVGVELPWVTEFVLVLSSLLSDYGLVVVPLAFAAPLALLRAGDGAPRAATAIHAVGVSLALVALAALVLPLIELWRKL